MKPSLAIIFLLLILAGCTPKLTQNASLVSNTATFQPPISVTAPLTEIPRDTPKPTLTLTPVPPTIPAATLNAAATLGVLEDLCDEFESDSSRSSEISPDGEWFATSCGYERNQMLIVQNQEGVKWVFEFADFLSLRPDLEGGPGSFKTMAWSLDSRFLYFTRVWGYSGGGNQCFPGYGVYGLYRLHLKTGTLVTLVPSDDWFPGNEIRFSPTNEYYAVDINGVTIANLISGEVNSINVTGVMEMSWSPDGKVLAFSVASCGENFVESSSILVWDSSTKQTQVLFSSEEMLLMPRAWISNSVLEFEGEKWVDNDYLYTIFEYDLTDDAMIFSGTATPRP